MTSAIRRLSGLFAQYQDEEDDEDVEVVEYMAVDASGATTARDERETVYSSKRKGRNEDQPAPRTLTELPSTVVTSGEVSMLSPPTKKRRILSQAIAALETLIDVIADEQEALSTRLEYCSNIWRFVREMHSKDVVEFVRQRSSSVVQLIETLLHTGYFPLQQLCFMTIAAILHQLHKRDTEALAAFAVGCKDYLSDADIDLLELLPMHETIPWHDPRVARHRIIQINRRTGLCHSFRVARCWVSPNKKQDLAHIRVNKWIDIGSTTTTFYWRDETDVVVVNVPHSCVEDVEIERQNCVLYIWTKSIERLKGVRLLAFATPEEEFPGLVKALVGVEIEGYTGRSPVRAEVDFGSPIQTLKTASTLALTSRSPPSSPDSSAGRLATNEVDDAFEPDEYIQDDHAFELEAAEVYPVSDMPVSRGEDLIQEAEENAAFDPFDGDDMTKAPTQDLESERKEDEDIEDERQETEDVEKQDVEEQDFQEEQKEAEESISRTDEEDSAKISEEVAKVVDSIESLHRRLDAHREAKAESSSDVEASAVKDDYALMETEQERRVSGVRTVVKRTTMRVRRRTRTTTGGDDSLQATPTDQEPGDSVFTSASFLLLLVVVLPWALFTSLHSGSDMSSVRQFAQDLVLMLTGLVRKWSSS